MLAAKPCMQRMHLITGNLLSALYFPEMKRILSIPLPFAENIVRHFYQEAAAPALPALVVMWP